jgi:hypothetical protein
MNHRRNLVALSLNTLVIGLLLAGCGDYGDDDDDSNTGGSTAVGGGTGVGGDATGAGGSDTGTGGGGPDLCANVTACGGDVVGTWNVTGSCLTVSGDMDVSSFGLGCPTVTATGTLTVAGTWTANGDGTYSDNTTTTGTETLELPTTCLDVSGTHTTCSRISAPLSSVGFDSVDCVDNAATAGCTCTCTIDQAGGLGVGPMYPSASGTYTVAGNTLTITAGAQEYSYCVDGTTLTVTPVSVGRTATITGSVQLQQ